MPENEGQGVSGQGGERIEEINNQVTEDTSNETTPLTATTSTTGNILTQGMTDAISNTVKNEIKKEIATDKASLFTVFGIFVSLVTFVSIEIQILKTACSIQNISGMSLIILASLIMFTLVLDYIGRGWRNELKVEIKQFPRILLSIIVLLLAAGVRLMSYGNEEICRENEVYQRYESEFTEKSIRLESSIQKSQGEFKEIMTKKIEEIDQKLKESQK